MCKRKSLIAFLVRSSRPARIKIRSPGFAFENSASDCNCSGVKNLSKLLFNKPSLFTFTNASRPFQIGAALPNLVICLFVFLDYSCNPEPEFAKQFLDFLKQE